AGSSGAAVVLPRVVLDGEMVVWNKRRRSFEPFGLLEAAVRAAAEGWGPGQDAAAYAVPHAEPHGGRSSNSSPEGADSEDAGAAAGDDDDDDDGDDDGDIYDDGGGGEEEDVGGGVGEGDPAAVHTPPRTPALQATPPPPPPPAPSPAPAPPLASELEVVYVVFDVLLLGQESTLHLPLRERQRLLAGLLRPMGQGDPGVPLGARSGAVGFRAEALLPGRRMC
ncbi:hypothetical protein Agub_g11787, partial [Astrephomene gubernaculifera]